MEQVLLNHLDVPSNTLSIISTFKCLYMSLYLLFWCVLNFSTTLKFHNFVQGNAAFHFGGWNTHKMILDRVRKEVGKRDVSFIDHPVRERLCHSHRDFHLQWRLFNNEDNNSHDPMLFRDIIYCNYYVLSLFWLRPQAAQTTGCALKGTLRSFRAAVLLCSAVFYAAVNIWLLVAATHQQRPLIKWLQAANMDGNVNN